MEEFGDMELGSFLPGEEKVWLELLGHCHPTSLKHIYFGGLVLQK